MKNVLDDNISVTHTMGGLMDFVEKGTYHNSLKISSTKYNKVWRIKMKDDSQKGFLRVNRKIVYNYISEDKGFSLQEVKNDLPVSEWISVNVIVIMRD